MRKSHLLSYRKNFAKVLYRWGEHNTLKGIQQPAAHILWMSRKGDQSPKLFPSQKKKNHSDDALCSKHIKMSCYMILVIVIVLNY